MQLNRQSIAKLFAVCLAQDLGDLGRLGRFFPHLACQHQIEGVDPTLQFALKADDVTVELQPALFQVLVHNLPLRQRQKIVAKHSGRGLAPSGLILRRHPGRSGRSDLVELLPQLRNHFHQRPLVDVHLANIRELLLWGLGPGNGCAAGLEESCELALAHPLGLRPEPLLIGGGKLLQPSASALGRVSATHGRELRR